jgi:hypothetical protein
MLQFARTNNQNCHEKHACGEAMPDIMPTRLLQIGIHDGLYSIKLVEEAACQPYVTLSHCWGTTPAATSTTTTLRDRKTDIPWSMLTQTFKDAVALTEQLGYEYLWIDALCILQDSKEDWEAESAKMHQVYANCDLMLSADGAKDGSVGFFRGDQIWTRSWEPLVSSQTQYGTRIRYSKAHHTFGRMLAMFWTPEECVYVYPLRTRAWCLQESFLAPRILHFGIDELHWECSEQAICQCPEPSNTPFLNYKTWLKRLVTTTCTPEDKATYWFNLSNQYSERALTDWTDRLLALSGLAKHFLPSIPSSGILSLPSKFHEVDLGDYLAGLWSSTIKEGLCWQAGYEPGTRISNRPKYIAPSWSWASVSGAINWPCREPVTYVVEVQHVSCELAGADPTGAISSANLVLFGKIIELKAYLSEWQTPNGDVIQYLRFDAFDFVAGSDEFVGSYRPDAVDDFEGIHLQGSLHYNAPAALVRGESLQWLKCYAIQISVDFLLVLRGVEGAVDIFERVGSIYNDSDPSTALGKSRFFEGIKAREITIL